MNISIAGEAAANSLLLDVKSRQDQHMEWLRGEIDKGLQSGIMAESFDHQNLDAFWDDIEALSDEKIRTNSINYDSAALSPL